MTNSEYIRQTINDRELAEIISLGFCGYTDKTLDCNMVFKYWSCGGKPTGNIIKNGIIPSVWAWEQTYDERTNKWKVTGRKPQLAMQVWLSMQYNKEYWDMAIAWYKKRWNK